MKKIITVFFILFVLPVNAATMCVPDLSACESCTDGTFSGGTWSANCCGISVSGIVLPFFGGVYGLTVSLDDVSGAEVNACAPNSAALCVMLEPVTTRNGYVAGCVGIYNTTTAAERCASSFKPKCIFSQCSFISVCGSGGS